LLFFFVFAGATLAVKQFVIFFVGATLAHFVLSLLVVLGASPGRKALESNAGAAFLHGHSPLASLASMLLRRTLGQISLRSLWPPQALSDAAIKGRVHYPVIFASLRSIRSLRADPKRLADRDMML
jgi:hypothetical protein